MKGFLLACVAVGAPALLIFYLEWRSHSREDRRTSALRAANRDGKGEGR